MGENTALHDIQSYLESFNKEISDAGSAGFDFNVADPLYGEGGPMQPTPVPVPGSPMSGNQVYNITQLENSSGVAGIITDSEPSTSQVKRKRGRPPKNAKGLVAPSENYQTVTIVPSEVSQSGEVSYVLIVSQPENDKDGENVTDANGGDMSVYDFKEEMKGGDTSGVTEEEEIADNEDDVDYEEDEETPKKAGRNSKKSLFSKDEAAGETYTCDYCSYNTNRTYLLARHIKCHSEERPHKCQICDRPFKTVASLQNHVNTHTGTKPHRCKECLATFTTSGELIRHVRYKHTFEKPHKCIECEYASVERSKLKRHMRSHTGERPYQCPHCNYASPDTYKLKRHLRIHTGERPYECPYCNARFTQSNSRKAHMLIHTGQKPIFQCELCPTTCGRKTDLKTHVLKLHTSDRPIQCKKCGKSFPDRYTYKVHLKIHEGEKCFRCELCSYSALTQRHLEAHILTHTGEKPFRCEMCDMSFRQKQLLKRHINIYHNPDYVESDAHHKVHHCTECGLAFAHNTNLMRHMLVHDPENPIYQQYLHQEDDASDANEEEEEDDEDEVDNTQDDIERFVADGDLEESNSLLDGPVHLQVVGADGKATTLIIQSVGNQLQASQLSQQLGSLSSERNDIKTEKSGGAMGDFHENSDHEEDADGSATGDGEPAASRTPMKITSSRGRKRGAASAEKVEAQVRTQVRSNRRGESGRLKEGDKKRESRRKDIETCFGFEAD